MKSVQLAHGSGGQAMQQLIGDLFMQAFANPGWRSRKIRRVSIWRRLPPGDRLAFSTDSYVIDPLFFPGGNIGKLAVCGTANDVAVSGAIPAIFPAGLFSKRGWRWLPRKRWSPAWPIPPGRQGSPSSPATPKWYRAARRISCLLTPPASAPSRQTFAGDAADQRRRCAAGQRHAGDHGATILNLREQMGLDGALSSDCAVLTPLIQTLRPLRGVKALRDATRGGVNAVAHEFAAASGCGIELHEAKLPVNDTVRGVCELLGLDALNFANEGKLVIAVAREEAKTCWRIYGLTPGTRGGDNRRGGRPPGRAFRRAVRREADARSSHAEPLPRIC